MKPSQRARVRMMMCLTLFVACSASPACGATLYVGPHETCTTIQAGANAAQPGIDFYVRYCPRSPENMTGVTVRHNLPPGRDAVLFTPEVAAFITSDVTLTADPLFVDPAPGVDDFHLRPGSPAIDVGIAALAPDHDLDGKTRPAGEGCDMGAYESGNGAVDRPGSTKATLAEGYGLSARYPGDRGIDKDPAVVFSEDAYYGNCLDPEPPVPVVRGKWICVEMMVQMNSSPEKTDGEQALWIDGKLAAHFAPGSVTGRWSYDRFLRDAKGKPLEGFRWRRDPRVKANAVFLRNYVSTRSFGEDGAYAGKYPDFRINTRQATVWFDHMVVSRAYVGPLRKEERERN